jgi:hypothetical protein
MEKDETIFSMVASKSADEDTPLTLALAFLLLIGRPGEAVEGKGEWSIFDITDSFEFESDLVPFIHILELPEAIHGREGLCPRCTRRTRQTSSKEHDNASTWE